MDVTERIELITRPPTEEVVTEGELRELLETEARPKHYIGLEISGKLHLGSLIVNGFKINDFLKAGVRTTILLADWHSYINEKLGGDWDRIRKAGRYYEEAFRFFCEGSRIIYGSDLYRGNDEYWENLVKICRHVSLARITRCLTIMGRSKKERLSFAQYLYPPMQASDIKALDLDIVHAGMDQRKVHMLVRDVFPKLGWKVPVAVHHSLLLGLEPPRMLGLEEDEAMDLVVSSKMSKSKPQNCIFIHDDEETLRKKVLKAWCPERVSENNPILEMARVIIFHEFDEFVVERPSKYGGDVTFGSFEELRREYEKGAVHPKDLKEAVARYLNRIIDPVRRHFENKKELLEPFEGYE